MFWAAVIVLLVVFAVGVEWGRSNPKVRKMTRAEFDRLRQRGRT